MKKIKQLLKRFKKVSTTKKAILALALSALLAPAAFAVWGPARPAFDWNTPEGKKGSLNGPVFNSFKNSPLYTDEFNFTSARNVNDNFYSNDLKVKDGDEVEFKLFIHNNANQSTNASGLGIAKDTYAGIDLPQNQFGTKNEPIGFVGASNATPKEVWDGTMLSSANGKKFKLDYLEGTAKLSILGGGQVLPLSDAFVSKNGTKVGSEKIDGLWKGCFEYVGWVNIRVKVIAEPEPEVPNFTIKKYVNGEDAQDNATAVKVKAGEQFDYRVDVTNTGDTELKNVKAWDTLPTGVSYVDNTLKLEGTTVTNDEDFFNANKGINIPSIAKGAKKSFTFKAIIPAKDNAEKEKACKPGVGTFYNNIAKADPEGPLPIKDDPAVVNCDYTPPKNEPAVNIEKSVSKPVVGVNESFIYTVKVTNTGNVDLKNVKVDDPAPMNVTFDSVAQTAGMTFTFSPSRIQAVIASLKIGESKSFNINARVTKYVPTQIINTACVNASEVNPENPTENDDCDDAPVTTVEFCPIPGKENLPKNDPRCGLPTELPSTGSGPLLAVAAAVLVGALAFVTSKKMTTKKVQTSAKASTKKKQ
ncbi:MAG: hypothetical protein QG623_430 [Patescibacteria group bacterium]|nr:hypothetical protein [Patescibacteria group bacterium]